MCNPFETDATPTILVGGEICDVPDKALKRANLLAK
jgi:hypothetical protein